MRLFLAIIAIFAIAFTAPAQSADTINFELGLLRNLELMYEQFETEYYVCIEGIYRDKTLNFLDFRMPVHLESTPYGVTVAIGCSQYENIVAVLHTHPDDSRSSCYLSKPDIVNALKENYAIVIVQCGPRRFAWWHRIQITRHRLLSFPRFNISPLPAFPSQMIEFSEEQLEWKQP